MKDSDERLHDLKKNFESKRAAEDTESLSSKPFSFVKKVNCVKLWPITKDLNGLLHFFACNMQ